MTKKLSFTLLCACFAFSLIAAPAINDPLIVRTTSNDDGIALVLANLEGVTTSVEFSSLDTKEILVDKQVRRHNGFSYDLNLDQLGHGRYLLKVTKADVVRQQVILVSEDGIFLSQIK